MFSDVPASQYWMLSRYTRTSCAGPGMNLSSFGIAFSAVICRSPLDLPSARLPRSFFRIPSGDQGLGVFSTAPPMSNLPSLVHRTSSAADTATIIASQ